MTTSVYENEMTDPWARRSFKEPQVVFDGVKRPLRDEDVIERHGGNGRPKVFSIKWLDEDPWFDIGGPTYYTRVSTLAKLLDRTENLVRWGERQIVKGMAARESLLAEVMQHQDNRDQLDRIVLDAKRAAEADGRALIGGAIHALSEYDDLGETPKIIPDRYRPHLEMWRHLTQHLQIVAIEKMMINEQWNAAGTPDRIVRYTPCEICGRVYYIADLKTGRVDTYTECYIGHQLGIYANSAVYNIKTGERSLPYDICPHLAIVVWIDKDNPETGRLQWVEIWESYQEWVPVCWKVQKGQSRHGILRPFVSVPNLDVLIEQADSRMTLQSMHAQHKDLWTPRHTGLAQARIKQEGW